MVDGVTVVIGDINEDIVVRPSGPAAADTDTTSTIDRRAGGSAANQASWLAHLGVPTRLAGRVGAADAVRLTSELSAEGVDARLAADPTLATGTVVVVVEGGRRDMYTDRGANTAFVAADLPPNLLDGAGHLHVSGYALVAPGARDAVADLVARARSQGLAVTADPGSAAELARWPGGPLDLLAPVGPVDALFPNLDEGWLLAADLGDSSIDAGPEVVVAALVEGGRLLRDDGVVVLKMGAAGVLVGSGERRWRRSAGPVEALDPTGAGDAFAAGYLARWREDPDPASCAEAGIAAALVGIGVVGARPPTQGA